MTMVDLATKSCEPCRGGVPPMGRNDVEGLIGKINGWAVEGALHHLSKTYRFADFKAAMAFAQRAGEVAEREGHHPDLTVSWGKVRVDIWTHKVDGLTESDFILAAKIDKVL